MEQPGEYFSVTEVPGGMAHKEQVERLYHRYHFATEYCKGRDVLEVACGSGMGLGYLAKYARKVVGGDIDESVLKFACDYYQDRDNIELKVLDGQRLPFDDRSFDVVILYEAIYYIPDPEKFVEEARRVLRENGSLIICTVNRDWPGFNASPHSHRYFSIPELAALLRSKGFDVSVYVSFLDCSNTLKDKVVSLIKQGAVKMHLIPKTMKGKEKLKRLFFGKLKPLPFEVSKGDTVYNPPVPVSDKIPDTRHKVLYAVGYVQQ